MKPFTKEDLIRLYWTKGMPKQQIAWVLETTYKTINEGFKKWGIPTKRLGHGWYHERENIIEDKTKRGNKI